MNKIIFVVAVAAIVHLTCGATLEDAQAAISVACSAAKVSAGQRLNQAAAFRGSTADPGCLKSRRGLGWALMKREIGAEAGLMRAETVGRTDLDAANPDDLFSQAWSRCSQRANKVVDREVQQMDTCPPRPAA